ncbi:PhoU domain-containing protein [Candidatus Fermentibacterales bacterium]|nr:PhoU domain-containing protein [Candidatus Fermentibacterales bacterium]
MFRRLFSWWKEDILLKRALEQSAEAIDRAGRIFSVAMDVATRGQGTQENVYEMDKTLNTAQIEIRKKVLEHLTINPEQDVTASLVLITIIVDVERVGDLAKNIVELPGLARAVLDRPEYAGDLGTMRERLESAISRTRDAFVEADAAAAEQVMETLTWVANRCDAMLQAVAGDESLGVRRAVAYCLLFRFIRRISLHTRNVASSVVNPFHKLGYKPD